MAACDLYVELSRSNGQFYVGEEVSGQLHVRVDKACKCNELDLRLGWRTHGKGPTERGGEKRLLLFSHQTWQPGVYRYPFTFALPAAPATYHGSLVNVDWYLTAEADIPWAFDPKAEQNITVSALPPEKRTQRSNQLPTEGRPRPTPQRAAEQLIAQNKPLLALILGAFFLGFVYFLFTVRENPLLLAATTIFFVFGMGRFGYRFVTRFLARQRLGNTATQIRPNEAFPGESFVVSFHIQPTKPVVIQGLNATLHGQEVSTVGHGSSRRTYRETIYKQTFALCEQERRLEAGRLFRLEGKVQLPVDAPTTFTGGANQVSWTITTEVDIPNFPDLREDHTVGILSG